jgi:hypothetical protein
VSAPPEVQTRADYVNRRIDEFVFFGIAEPTLEGRRDPLGSVPLPELAGQKGAQVSVVAERGREPRKILGREAVEKDADAFRAGRDHGFVGEKRHDFVVPRPQRRGNDKAFLIATTLGLDGRRSRTGLGGYSLYDPADGDV